MSPLEQVGRSWAKHCTWPNQEVAEPLSTTNNDLLEAQQCSLFTRTTTPCLLFLGIHLNSVTPTVHNTELMQGRRKSTTVKASVNQGDYFRWSGVVLLCLWSFITFFRWRPNRVKSKYYTEPGLIYSCPPTFTSVTFRRAWALSLARRVGWMWFV